VKAVLVSLLWLAHPAQAPTPDRRARLPPAVRALIGDDWQPVQGDEALRYTYGPLRYSTETWYGSTFWTGPDWTRVGRDWQHSGTQVASVRVFHAPKAGRVRVTGHAYKADTKCGDGVVTMVRHNGRTLWRAEIDAADTKGAEHDLSLDLIVDDRVQFVLHRRGEISCDTTYWDPAITYETGETFRASEGFSDKLGVWTYELETDAGAVNPLAEGWQALQWLSPDRTEGLLYVSRSESETPEQTVRFSGLTPAITYGVFDPFGTEEAVRTGDDLVRTGLPLAVPHGGHLALAYQRSDGAPSTAPPQAPRELRATSQGPHAVALSWTAVPGARYLLWRDGDLLATSIEGAECVDETVDGTEPHRYAVQAQRGFLRSAPVEAATQEAARPELALWRLVEEDWFRSDGLTGAHVDWGGAAQRVLESGRDLAQRLRATNGKGILAEETRELLRLEQQWASTKADDRAEQRALYLQARWLKRRIALANPLADCGPLLFVKRVPTEYSHLVMQYFSWRARPGGGLYVLDAPGRSLKARNLLDGQVEGGSVLDPCLHWDAQRIVFSYSKCTPDDPYFHIYEIRSDGTGLRQLTSGEYEDLMPQYLPDGGIALCSTRRRGYARCFGAQFGDRWHVYTLHRMDADGSNIRTLSYHETNEWFPTVLNDGSIAYARWDYVDRHAVLHQNLWRTNPDGTGAAVLWGNHTESPHCSFEAQPIPGSSKIICTASAHHSITAGSIIIIDPNVDSDGQAAVERITPEIRFPEAEGWIDHYYATPWPLSEDYYLVSYSHERLVPEPNPNAPNALGLYLLDRWGNRELLYRDPQIGCTSPTPLRPRPTPPVVPSTLPPGAADEGRFLLLDVYQGLPDEYRGQIKALRIVQVLPKATPVADDPPVGLAGQEPTKMILGTVPVEPDGSAYFMAPARRPLLFQALDERGLAIQTMRSITYLQPGEEASCVGCHEPRTTTPEARLPLAAKRPASAIEAGPDGTQPFSFVRLVQPVLDRYCVRCHGDDQPGGGLSLTATIEDRWTKSYLSLTGGKTFYGPDTNETNARAALVPRYGGWNSVHSTPPGGLYGSRGSRLVRMLLSGHGGVELDAESLERLAMWIDANALFYGTYDRAEQAKQLRGEAIDVPPLQ
jgi:hypothetical protein